MPDLAIARNILLFVLALCIFLSLGAFFAKRITLERLFKYAAIAGVIALVGGVIYIAVISFASAESSQPVKNALLLIGIIVACCIFLAAGGYLGKKIEVFRVVIASGIIVLLAIIIFLIYLAYLFFFASAA
jgi:lysylphosphatidylglycerol synthetase-like protein (DUF2156 family)